MIAKEKLDNIRKLHYKISKQRELAILYEQKSHTVAGPCYDREIVSCSKSYEAPFVKWVYKKMEMEEKIKANIELLEKMVNEISPIIDRLESEEGKTILISRYVLNMDWDEIARTINYSLPSVFRFHREAINELENLIANDSA